MAEHVGGDVAAVDVNAGLQQRQQHAACAATYFQGGLAEALDGPEEERRFGCVVNELGPALGHQAVVPDERVSG